MTDEEPVTTSRCSGTRKTLSLRSNAVRQVAVNFLPSRNLPHSTLKARRSFSEDNILLDNDQEGEEEAGAGPERQADMIVKEMEQNQHLMQDDPQSEELRREALRDLPEGLTMKRTVRAKLSVSVSLRSKRRPISMMKRLQYQISFTWKRSQDRLRDLLFSVELWYEAIRNIEGHFGSAVGSYFRFLRWMFAADVLLSLFSVCLVTLPQVLYDGSRNDTRRVRVGVLDVFSGKGGLEDTVLFYGHYHDGIIAPLRLSYNMPFAYFFTMISLYLATFGILCYKTAYSYRRNFICADGSRHALAHKVFCGWDYGIVSQHAARLHATSIYNEFQEILNERSKSPTSNSLLLKLGQYLANTVVTTFVIGIIIGLQYGLWLLLGLETRLEYWELCVSFVITVVLTLFPVLFSFIVRLEYYTPRTALYVTLARTWVLDIGTMMLLLFYWTKSKNSCWESHLGEESYRLVALDALVSLLLLPALEAARGCLYKMNSATNPPEFNIAYNSLTIIYNQAVLWFGMLFSPLLPVAVAIKLLLLFYVKRECAMRACQPARKVWRAAQTQTMLYLLVTLSLFAALLGIGTLFLRMSSQSCGPFRSYEYVYSVFTEGVLQLNERDALRHLLIMATRPGVIGLLALILGVSVYYMRARALAQRFTVDILRRMLLLQAKDKDFLLTAIAKVSNGEWMYSPKPEDEAGPNSHTWKYLQQVRKPSNADYHFDASRLSHSYIERPKSYLHDNRPNSYHPETSKSNEDGDTDSSFSWQGSTNYLNKKTDPENGN